jgi:hypothetical protein
LAAAQIYQREKRRHVFICARLKAKLEEDCILLFSELINHEINIISQKSRINFYVPKNTLKAPKIQGKISEILWNMGNQIKYLELMKRYLGASKN